MRRLKSHFITLPCGVDLILGLNGYIWVSKHLMEAEQEGGEGFDAETIYSSQNDVRSFDLWTCEGAWITLAGHRRPHSNSHLSRLQHHPPSSDALYPIERYLAIGSV